MPIKSFFLYTLAERSFIFAYEVATVRPRKELGVQQFRIHSITDQLLKQEYLLQAFTPHQLADGSSTAYGYRWRISEYEGHRLTGHDGEIHGFKTHAIRMQDDRILVAVLSNNGGEDPEQLAFEIGHSYRPALYRTTIYRTKP